MRDIEKALEEKKQPNPTTLLSEDYYDFLDVFLRTKSNKLTPHRLYNYNILLKPGIEPPAEALQKYSYNELLIMHKYLTEYILKGWIRASRFLVAALMLLIKKPRGGIRFYVDYRGLNNIIIKN